MVVALLDLVKREHTLGPKWMWIIVVVVFNLIGPLVYLFVGRRDE
ncbi:MAG: PLDc_N domain-containing protein [Chloroflexi bacterium]|nr:PLDc_N domain-containing protein [Chloroflexota bacterium]